MAQYEVHLTADGQTYVVDCQSDLLTSLDTRFVIPLLPEGRILVGSRKLNPTFSIEGRRMVLAPQAATTLRRRDLGRVVASLREHFYLINAALDVITSGI